MARERIRITGKIAGLVALCAVFAAGARSQSIYDTYSGFTVPTTPMLPLTEQHPSLHFTTSELPALQVKKADPAYAALWSRITTNIAKFLGKTVSTSSVGDRPKIAMYGAFAWIMNGDTVGRNHAVEALLSAYDNVPQTAVSTSFDKPYDEIYRATWIQDFCTAYDWLAPVLSPQQDSSARARIIREANLLCDNMRSGVKYASRPHNHRSKPAYGVGTAALTLSSDPNASRWLDSALTNVNTVTKYQFSSDGIYREGPHYYIYTLVNAIPFLWQYKIVSGVDLFPAYQAAFEWPVLIRDQRGWMPNTEDANVKPAPTHMVAAAYPTAPTRLHSTAPLASILQWNWATTTFFTVDYTGATNEICWDIDEFLFWDASIPSVAPDIDPTLRLATGEVVFRNRWAGSDSTGRYLLFHAVAAADNHDHPDQLSYVINARNSCLAIDAGYGQDQTNYATWYTKPLSHNLVMTNSTAPSDFQVNQTPPDRHFLVTPFFDLSEKQAKTSATSGTIVRGIACVDKDFWIVYDRPSTSQTGVVYALEVHGRGTMSRTSSDVTWTAPSDKYGSAARLHASVLTSGTPTIADKTGTTCLFKDSVAQSYVDVQQTGSTVGFLHLLRTTSSSTMPSAAADISTGSGMSLVFTTSGAATDQVIVPKSTGIASAGSLASDASFAWSRSEGDILTRFAVVEGTLLRWMGKDVLVTDHPITLAADWSSAGIRTLSVDSVSVPISVTLHLEGVTAVELNNAPIAFSSATPGACIFTLSTGGAVRITGGTTAVAGDAFSTLPSQLMLDANYPNPFNPTTRIRFTLPVASRVQVRIYNGIGQLIRTLLDAELGAGVHQGVWDGRDGLGRDAASGVYVFEVNTNAANRRTKGLLLR